MQSKIKILSVCGIGLLSALLVYALFLLPGTVLAERAMLAMDGQKIVTASTVRFREQPSLDADVVGHVGLGAVLRATQRTEEKLQTGDVESYWYLIDANEQQGWISGQFLRDFKPEQKEEIWFSIIRERMANPDLSFTDRVAVYRFVDLVAEKTEAEEANSDKMESDKLGSAFALGRLLALQKAFDQVNPGNAQEEPFQAWIKEHEAEQRVFHDEISGQWLVPATDYWKLADSYKGRKGSDEINWYAANAQLGGECEGDIECNLNRDKMTQGEYLRRHPHGRYADKALKQLSDSMEYMLETLEKEPNYFSEFRAAGDVIDELFEIIATANPKLSQRPVAFKQIKAIRRIFRQG